MEYGGVTTHVDDCFNEDIQAEASYLQSLYDVWNDLYEKGNSPTGSQLSAVDWNDSLPSTHPPARLLALAQWAFAHLPGLKIIAYGDYSRSGRFADYTKTLCRNESTSWKADDQTPYCPVSSPSDLTFRPVTASDTDLQILLKASQGMLGACPVDRHLQTDVAEI